MSPDNIFASQMWAWPDPVIKRDMSGRVLFLNMAFLALYGGTAEAWHGNVVAGWPMPNPAQGINRFETRIPVTPQAGQPTSEIVYDWVEHMLPDGHAMAVARDVTAFLSPVQVPVQQPATAPVTEVPVADSQQASIQAQPDTQLPAQTAADMMVEQPPVQQSAAQFDQQFPQNAQTAVESSAPVTAPAAEDIPNPMTQAAAAEPRPVSEPAAPLVTDTVEVSTQHTSGHHTPVQEEPIPAAPVIETAEAEASPTPEMEVQERDFERRALPIENQDSVLGNNWRDAVIAKAVGVEAESDETVPDSANESTADMQAQNMAGPSAGLAEGGAPKILLAEDNAINALLTRTLLEAEGCTVDVVEDGQLAVQAVKNARYDMIFMDMRMPNMDGLEATRKIRALDHASKGLPIVALTANAFDDDRNACFDSGMNDFMTKPVSAEELSAMVKTWTQKSEERLAS